MTVRGNARDVIFHAPEDYERFLKQLQSALESDGVMLYAYVLMPNHAHLNGYAWSSYRAYVEGAAPNVPVDTRWLLMLGRRPRRAQQLAYRAYVESLVDGEYPVLKEACLASRYAIGDERFRAQIDDELNEARLHQGVYGGDIAWPVGHRPELATVLELVAAEFGLPVTALKAHGKGVGVAKSVAAELCSRYCGLSQRAVGHALGCPGNGAVGKQRLRLRRKLADDNALARRIERIRDKLTNVKV